MCVLSFIRQERFRRQVRLAVERGVFVFVAVCTPAVRHVQLSISDGML